MAADPDLWGCDRICDYFSAKGMTYERLDHPPVYTAEEAERLVPAARGAHAKNLLVEDRRDGRLFMLTVPFGVRVDLAGTAAVLGTNKLRFAPAGVMQATLGVTPGAVSMLALVNDRAGRVTLVLDQSLAEAEALQCHPLVNTATLVIDRDNLFRFLSEIAHAPRVFPVPVVAS
ncbi:MAG: prolyl-tRNA synthetase associated domain-containing protein [Burkholderiales bacterium]|nr:prolyl-tRNA synthetase associated domain-containing protein [Burkholderiales bacterium]